MFRSTINDFSCASTASTSLPEPKSVQDVLHIRLQLDTLTPSKHGSLMFKYLQRNKSLEIFRSLDSRPQGVRDVTVK